MIYLQQVLHSIAPAMHELTSSILVKKIEDSIQSGKPLNILETFQHLAMSFMVATSLGVKNLNVEPVVENTFLITSNFSNPLYLIPYWYLVPSPNNRKIEAAFKTLDDIIYKLISDRRKEREKMTDEQKQEVKTLLDMLIEARDEESGSGLSDIEVREKESFIGNVYNL